MRLSIIGAWIFLFSLFLFSFVIAPSSSVTDTSFLVSDPVVEDELSQNAGAVNGSNGILNGIGIIISVIIILLVARKIARMISSKKGHSRKRKSRSKSK